MSTNALRAWVTCAAVVGLGKVLFNPKVRRAPSRDCLNGMRCLWAMVVREMTRPIDRSNRSHTGLILTLNAVKEKTKTLFTLILCDPACRAGYLKVHKLKCNLPEILSRFLTTFLVHYFAHKCFSDYGTRNNDTLVFSRKPYIRHFHIHTLSETSDLATG